jgi:hypothetical protein
MIKYNEIASNLAIMRAICDDECMTKCTHEAPIIITPINADIMIASAIDDLFMMINTEFNIIDRTALDFDAIMRAIIETMIMIDDFDLIIDPMILRFATDLALAMRAPEMIIALADQIETFLIESI